MEIRPFAERRPNHFRDELPPLTGRTIRFEKKFNGILESIKVRFWGNTALQIKVKPFIEKLGSAPSPLVNFFSYPPQTRDFLDGNDEACFYDVKIPFKKDEVIGFNIQNINGVNSYEYNIGYEFISLN